MNALDAILQEHIIEPTNSDPNFCAFCYGIAEFGVVNHRDTCPLVPARIELARLRRDNAALLEALKPFADAAGREIIRAAADDSVEPCDDLFVDFVEDMQNAAKVYAAAKGAE